MADINLFETFAKSGSVDVFIYSLYGLLIVGIIGIVIYLFWLFKQYNIEVEITDVTSGGRRISKDKARYYRDKDGRNGWQLLKSRDARGKGRKIIDEVANEYIDLTKNGKMFVRFKKLEGNTLKPWHPMVKDESDETLLKSALPSSLRQAAIYELQKAESLHGKKSIGEIILQFMPYVLILMMVFGFVIMMDQTGETLNTVMNSLQSHQKEATERERIFQETQQEFISFIEGKQIIKTTPDKGEAPD